ncbi:hypothetical protein EJ913_17600 [Azospirillum doebereinerae]|uniref:Uncharacterized protein n=1 Tax=Azospirillum doebereinerae TaxID=92933 RepID=A0A433J6I5_9PROT|nr:hypothetical protein EJ913_17600 [Azospirillum doebereinerae]
MLKPQRNARTHLQAMLSRDRILCLLTADPLTGEVAQIDKVIPGWLIKECHDRGLVTPGY